MRNPSVLLCASLLLAATTATAADTGVAVYAAIGVKPADVLTSTVLNTRVVAGQDKQVVSMTTYFTGRREKAEAVGVRLDVLVRAEGKLKPIYTRDFGGEHPGGVGDGNLQLVDLDMDGVNEIIVSFDSFQDPLIEQRLGEVIVHGDNGFRAAWSGAVEYDATRAARSVPPERRDRYNREVDIPSTMRTRGLTLFMQKQVIAVAGERLAEPKMIQETFPLRAANEHR